MPIPARLPVACRLPDRCLDRVSLPQAVDTADGKRIRVRVGPFASRDEADKVAAKVRGGGLSTAVLTL